MNNRCFTTRRQFSKPLQCPRIIQLPLPPPCVEKKENKHFYGHAGLPHGWLVDATFWACSQHLIAHPHHTAVDRAGHTSGASRHPERLLPHGEKRRTRPTHRVVAETSARRQKRKSAKSRAGGVCLSRPSSPPRFGYDHDPKNAARLRRPRGLQGMP